MDELDEKNWVPRVDMEFASDEEAYQFYNNYARVVGFSVRKAWVNRRASGVIISRTYVCYKEGYQGNKKDESEVKKPRRNERTGCLAHMTVKITISGRYRVSEFHPMHNHDLVPLVESSNLKSHRVVKRSRAAAANLALQNPTFEHLVRQSGGYRQVAFVSIEDAADKSWAPKVDMEFESDEKAYQFYNDYARRIGFDVRKAWVNRRASGVIISRTYVCYKEGYYGNKRDGSQVKKHRLRPNERTGCHARMIVKLAKNGKYRVSNFQPMHNHEFVDARTAYTLKTYRTANKARNTELESAGFSNDANGHGNGQCSAHGDLRFSSIVSKNFSPARQRDARKPGDFGATMEYLQERQVNDPSFYYALQLDSEDQIINVFWTDGKSVSDYYYFSDVICFDTTYKSNSYDTPLAPFYGVNHHKQIVIFGSALLYDESEDSFKWLLKTFKSAMYGKQPKVILTDQNSAMLNAVASMWSGTVHRVCVWHMYHSAVKHLGQVFQGSRTFAHDFSTCLFDCEEVEKFVTEWKAILAKYELKDNEWLNELFEDRERWAIAYGRETFSADMRNTQRITKLDGILKEHLNSATDLLQFLKHYERLVDELRDAEHRTDFSSTQSVSVTSSSRMLNQAANLYTPAVFDMFQREFEMSMDCMVFNCGMSATDCEYKVTSEESPEEHLVRFNPLDGTLACSCKKFEFVGIQCRHVLKALDIINIKELPLRYFLKRWRKDAKTGLVREICGLSGTDPKFSKAKRFSSLCHLFGLVAARAAETIEGHAFLENQSQKLLDHVYQIPLTRPLDEPQFS
ncbi:protein FAR1-RELATED SEQUENCE 5-like [Typha angustifolia]|uniref:protein FAR1-RELATED SEQUENCE 5-like n=1 Tax=Typha angustifolia TaxID=59011 RepID=UPI003C2D6AA2